MRRMGTALRKCSFSRPSRRVTTRPASSSTLRCFMTPNRVISSSHSSSLNVWPSRLCRRSSRNRREESARALKTRSSLIMVRLYVTIWSHVKASEFGTVFWGFGRARALFERQHEPAPRPDRDFVRGHELLERERLALESEEVDAVGDQRALLRHAERLQIDLHLARILAIRVDARDIPGLARAPRHHHVFAREAIDEFDVIPHRGHVFQEIAHVDGCLRHALRDFRVVLDARSEKHRSS